MYELDELVGNQYKYICESENVLEIDKMVFKLSNYNIPCRILYDNQVLIFLNGSKEQYMYWKNEYVRNNKITKKLERLKR